MSKKSIADNEEYILNESELVRTSKGKKGVKEKLHYLWDDATEDDADP